jgi:hypothetical protein
MTSEPRTQRVFERSKRPLLQQAAYSAALRARLGRVQIPEESIAGTRRNQPEHLAERRAFHFFQSHGPACWGSRRIGKL